MTINKAYVRSKHRYYRFTNFVILLCCTSKQQGCNEQPAFGSLFIIYLQAYIPKFIAVKNRRKEEGMILFN